MAFGNPGARGASAPMTEINIVPLVDVMLVLLVIFIITAPLLGNAVKIDLPRASSAPDPARPHDIQLAIDGGGNFYWNGEALDRATLDQRLREAGRSQPVPELHLHADKATRYEVLAGVMSQASRDGVTRIGFVTDPPAAGP
ncbi:MAG TPA: biopolymer transporter ExbD [Nevskia sp.]|nr:biopolymer transporter ExbD [Nevskia sp.]